MRALAILLLLAVLVQPVARAAPAELRFVAPTNAAEPLARFESGRLVGGLLKDIGDALAARLGLRAVYLSMPSKRVAQALAGGEGQIVCHVMPGWIDGDLLWTQALIPNSGVLAARAEAPAVQTLAELRGQRVGTVLGYRYLDIDPAGRLPFDRFDAPSTQANLGKLAAGRMAYAMVDELALRDYQRRHPQAGLRLVLRVARYVAPCALSRAGGLSLEAVDRALSAMVAEGELARLLARYGS